MSIPVISSPGVKIVPHPISKQPQNTGARGSSSKDRVPDKRKMPKTLQILSRLDTLIIKQKADVVEVIFEKKNQYEVMDTRGNIVFTAKEENPDCDCIGSLRGFTMDLMNSQGRPLIDLSRPTSCQGCCFPCCLQSIEVFSPPGVLAGRVKEEWTLFTSYLTVIDAAGEVAFRIQCPLCTGPLAGNAVFKILSVDGLTEFGRISMFVSGRLREVVTDANNFRICFPCNIDVNLKAVLLGAVFLIDYMFYEVDTDPLTTLL